MTNQKTTLIRQWRTAADQYEKRRELERAETLRQCADQLEEATN